MTDRDSWTNWRTDRYLVTAVSALCIASRGKNHWKENADRSRDRSCWRVTCLVPQCTATLNTRVPEQTVSQAHTFAASRHTVYDTIYWRWHASVRPRLILVETPRLLVNSQLNFYRSTLSIARLCCLSMFVCLSGLPFDCHAPVKNSSGKFLMEIHLRTTGCRLPYGITQYYLPPNTSEHAPV